MSRAARFALALVWLFACGSRSDLLPSSLGSARGGEGAVAGATGGGGVPNGGGLSSGGVMSGGAARGGRGSIGGAMSTGGRAGGGVSGSGEAGEDPGSAGAGGAPPEPCPRGQTRAAPDEDCTPIRVKELTHGGLHACAILSDDSARCWGSSSYAQLGYGDTLWRADDEPLSTVQPLQLTNDASRSVKQLAAGEDNSCALFDDGSVKCWGRNLYGLLGYGNAATKPIIGDGEPIADLAKVSLGARASFIAAGPHHTCAILESGTVKCWGHNDRGQLGYGHTSDVGYSDTPADEPAFSVSATDGVEATTLCLGYGHTCALLSDGSVKCWGASSRGQLGQGSTLALGDDEPVASWPSISLSSDPSVRALSVTCGTFFNCALLSDGTARCWGNNDFGELGRGDSEIVGDNELPSSTATLDVSDGTGTRIVSVAAGSSHACALRDDGLVKCWGYNGSGQLGYAIDAPYVGDDEPLGDMPAFNPSQSPQDRATQLLLGGDSSCALLASGKVTCWGFNRYGQLGHGDTMNIGDDEAPSSVPPLRFF